MARDRFLKQSLGNLYTLVKEARVLLVGAGGIGCELLKDLLLTGYGEIHIIDLDTIDLSNLNRQFLFRAEHIQQPKAIVAKQMAQKFNPEVKLVAYHANIKDSQFNLEWFSQFTLVFNALDNLDARRHVNRMCLVADIPLIESGTTGYNGQVQVIKKGKTACYDCNPKATPKTYPVCTIRSTPSQPIHTIVWAKSYLLPELFGESEDEIPEMDTTDSDNVEEIANLKAEAQALKKIRESMGMDGFARKVFDKVFKADIERLAKLEDMWKQRKPPTPLSWEALDHKQDAEMVKITVSERGQRAWKEYESFVVFRDSISRLVKRMEEASKDATQDGLPAPMINFDKDDEDTLDFVTAAANLRSIIFGIEPKSKFDTKQMAGNIIPAIATTNAMVAGLCVMQAFKVMREKYAQTKMIFLDRGSISAGNVDPPNPECPVCSTVMAKIQIDFEKATLGNLVNDVLKEGLEYREEIALTHGQDLIYDPDMEDNLEKKLSDLNVEEGSFLLVKDEEETGPRVDVQLLVEAKKDGSEDTKPVVLVGEKLQIPNKKITKLSNGLAGADAQPEVVAANGTTASLVVGKRKRGADDSDEESGVVVPAKKVQTEQSGKANDAIVLDEEEGAIEID